MSVTRRSVLIGGLGAAGLVAVAGCEGDDEAPPAGRLGAADRTTLAAAIDAERRIVALYDAQPANGVAVALAREQHVAHLAALRQLEKPATPAVTPQVDTGERVRPLVTNGARRLQAMAVAAGDGELAAILASIAASHLTPPPLAFEGEWWGDDPA